MKPFGKSMFDVALLEIKS